MADYIYLLQNRLTPAQWRALEAVREAARAQGMPVFLVGGAVRDLTTGSPVRDLDFAVQGDARALVPELEAKGALLAGENAVLGSIYLTFRGGVRAEVAPTSSVTYPKPGKPEIQSAVILDDLRRRDFTANAMAVSLNEGSYGLLLDPLNGTADIENRELRLISPYGFIEQPALLLRAARLGERLGWSLEERTQGRYENSKEEGHIQALPDADRRYEVEEVFHEEDPLAILEHLLAEGWSEVLLPGLLIGGGDRGAMDEVRELAAQLEGQGLHPDLSAIFFPLVTGKMSEEGRTALKSIFARQGFVRQIDTLEARGKELAAQLTSKAAAQPSDVWRLIMNADPEVILYLAYHSRSGAVQAKIKAFLKDWPQMRQKVPYALMQEMRITPDLPEYDKLVDDLFFALIDGKLETTEATRGFLEPYSPPAPPQVTVRRRPAKSTRSRAKKVAEEVASEPLDAAEDEDDEDTADDDDREDKRAKEPAAGEDDAEDEENDADEDKPVRSKPGPSPKKPRTVAKPEPEEAKPATEAKQEPANAVAPPVKTAEVKVPSKVPAREVASKPPVAPPPTPGKAKTAAKETVAPAKTGGKPAAKPSQPAKASPAKKTAPVKMAANASAAKKAPATVTKAPAKKTAPAKVAVKVSPAKVAAKKQPAKGQSAASTKKGAPVKSAKKAAAKGRSGR